MSHSRMTRVIAFIAFLTAAHAVPTHAAPPANFTYQGQLKLEGVPVTGEIDFRFTLWDAPEEGREVAEGIELRRVKVVNGLFAVNLDFGPEVFNGEPRWLQIAARESEREEFIVLTPRQPITPTPVALFAMTGNQGPPGPQGPAGEGMTLPYAGTVESSDVGAFVIMQTGFAAAVGIAIDNAGNTQPALGIVNAGSGPGVLSMTASGHAIWGQTGPGGGHAGFFKTMGTDNSQAALLAHNQAIGSAGHFKVTKRENTNPALLVETWSDGSAAHFKTYRDPNNVNLAPTILAESDQYASAGHFKIINDATTATALRAETLGGGLAFEAKTASTGGAGKFEITNVANTNTALEAVTNGTGHAASFTATNTSTDEATLMVEARGNNAAVHAEALGDGTALFGRASLGADAVVGISNGFGQAGIFQVNDPDNNKPAVEVTTAGIGGAGKFEITKVANTKTALEAVTSGTGDAIYGRATSGDGLRGYSTSGSGAYGFSASGSGVYGYSHSGYGVQAMSNGAGTSSPALYAKNIDPNGIAIFSTTTSGDANAVFVNKGAGNIIKGFSGPGGGDLVFEVTNDGTTITNVLQINGGADLAESFDVVGSTAAKPGMVVCIDADNAGKLIVSRRANDRTVAGVISGAGGINPGMIMGKKGSVADGDHPVALAGRVWTWCDASHSSIKPGDLLTTSDVPGHATKVTDYDRAQGAIIGKAMTSLDGGTGLVLVLVSLQ